MLKIRTSLLRDGSLGPAEKMCLGSYLEEMEGMRTWQVVMVWVGVV